MSFVYSVIHFDIRSYIKSIAYVFGRAPIRQKRHESVAKSYVENVLFDLAALGFCPRLCYNKLLRNL